jgi:4-amino-4-deoxy-L-arabinose transferase-like glycosyltransferase
MKKSWLILGFILLLQVGLRLPFLAEPLSLDEATYGQIARRMAQGEQLYRDLVDVKPPAVFLIFQALGSDPEKIRLVTAGCGALVALLLFLLGRQLFNDRVGLAAAALYALFGGGVFIEGTQANPENFMLLPLLAALSCTLAGGWWLLAAGLFSGLAIMVKQTAAFNLAALLLFVLFKKEWKGSAMLVLGSLVVPLLCLAYYRTGLVAALFYYSAGMVKLSLINPLIKTVFLFLFENGPLWVLAAVGLVYIWRQPREERSNLLLLWSVGSAVGCYLAGYALGHYFIQLVPALCLWGAIALVKVRFDRLAIILLGIFSLFIVANQAEFYLVYSPEQIVLERGGSPAGPAGRRIGETIARQSQPGEAVFGLATAVFYSGRNSPNKYFIAVRGGQSELRIAGRLIYSHNFGIKRDPRLQALIDQDFFRSLSDPRTRYYVVDLKDNYSPPGTNGWLKKCGYILDPGLSDLPAAIFVFRRR